MCLRVPRDVAIFSLHVIVQVYVHFYCINFYYISTRGELNTIKKSCLPRQRWKLNKQISRKWSSVNVRNSTDFGIEDVILMKSLLTDLSHLNDNLGHKKFLTFNFQMSQTVHWTAFSEFKSIFHWGTEHGKNFAASLNIMQHRLYRNKVFLP